MIEKKTIIDQIEVARSGHVQIRFGLILIEDDVEIGCQWHRTSVEPGGNVDAMIAAVNADITTRDTLKAQPVTAEKIPLLKSLCALVHTPDVVKAYHDRIAANEAALLAAVSGESEAKPKKI